MDKKFEAVSDGTFCLQESEQKNQFFFYREDLEILNDEDAEAANELYQAYVFRKMMTGEINGMFGGKITMQKSSDGKCFRVLIEPFGGGENKNDANSKKENEKPQKFFKRLLKRITG